MEDIMIKRMAFLLFITGFLGACSESNSSPAYSPQVINGTPLEAANTVVHTIKKLQEDSSGGLIPFINLFDSDGVLFSADYYIEDSDRLVTAAEFESEFLLQNPPKHIWGIEDGSGEPIHINIHEYFSHYVWNFPYDSNATITLINNSGDYKSQGNLINNMLSYYASSQFRIIEYHQSGTNPSLDGMDWTSLMLVLKRQGTDQWSLVGLAHGAWTI